MLSAASVAEECQPTGVMWESSIGAEGGMRALEGRVAQPNACDAAADAYDAEAVAAAAVVLSAAPTAAEGKHTRFICESNHGAEAGMQALEGRMAQPNVCDVAADAYDAEVVAAAAVVLSAAPMAAEGKHTRFICESNHGAEAGMLAIEGRVAQLNVCDALPPMRTMRMRWLMLPLCCSQAQPRRLQRAQAWTPSPGPRKSSTTPTLRRREAHYSMHDNGISMMVARTCNKVVTTQGMKGAATKLKRTSQSTGCHVSQRRTWSPPVWACQGACSMWSRCARMSTVRLLLGGCTQFR